MGISLNPYRSRSGTLDTYVLTHELSRRNDVVVQPDDGS